VTDSEAEFQAKVVELARRFNWRTWHVGDSRRVTRGHMIVPDRGIAGFPDLVLAHSTRGLVFAELKRDAKARVRPAQAEALDVLAASALLCRGKVRVHLWRPDDMVGVIVPVLRDGRGPVVYGF